MFAVKLTEDEFIPFIEKLEGDRKIVAYAINPGSIVYEGDVAINYATYHSLIISGINPQGPEQSDDRPEQHSTEGV